MINTIISNQENTLITELPKSDLKFYMELCSIGIRKAPERISLIDDEDNEICVKFYADSDIGNHLLSLLTESITLPKETLLRLA